MKPAIYSTNAEADLEEIADYIARDNPRRALSFISELRAAGSRIARTPRGSPLVSGYETKGLRRRAYGNYSIYYRLNQDAVEIARILHQARDQEAALEKLK